MHEDLRRNNLATLVRHLHFSGPLTRSQLAARTGLNRSTVGALVGELASVSLVSESAPEPQGAAGRPSLLVSLSAQRVWALAVEIRPDALAVARVGLGGQVHETLSQRRDWKAGLTPVAAVGTIGRLARELMSRAPAGSQLVGAAVAVPGIVRRSDGFVHLAPNLLWHDVPLGHLVSKRLPVLSDVLVANEADLGALAESSRGAAVGCKHVIYISGDAGVGGGILVDGSLLAGRSGYAGEVGHMKVNPDGHRCRCGGRGCWESEIGAAAVLRREVTLHAPGIVRETGRWVGRGAANLINIFNPDVVVFGGALRNLFLVAEPVITRELRRQVLPQAGTEATVVAAGLGAGSVLVGAAELAFSDFLVSPKTAVAAGV